MKVQPRRRQSILTPEMRREIAEKQQVEKEAQSNGKAGAPGTGAPVRPKLKLPGEKKEGAAAQNEPAANPVPARREPFEERYRRVTTYLERDLHARIQELRGSGRVGSVTALYNAALTGGRCQAPNLLTY